MTVDERRLTTYPRGWRVVAGGMVAALTFGYASLGVMAQDATPAASPVVGECVAPELPPGSPTPMEEMASPAAETDMAMASPVAEEEEEAAAAPEAPAGTTAEGETADTILGAVRNIVDCVNGGNMEGAVALMTTDFTMSEFDTANPYDVVAGLEGFSFGEAVIDNPLTYEDGSVSADVQYMASEFQISKERWVLVDIDGTWTLDSYTYQEPDYDGDLAVVGVLLGENEDGTYYITPNAPSSTEGGALILHGVNEGAEAHQILAIAVPEGADPMGLLDGSLSQEDITFYGEISLESGEQGDLMLTGLPVGVVTLVCFFSGPDGVPHAMAGMISQIEITAAA